MQVLSRRRAIFHDVCGTAMSRSQTDSAARQARRAARDAQESLTLTARRQYRRYRAQAGDVFLDWPRWQGFYLEAYHRTSPDLAEKNQWGGMPPGSFGGTF